MEKISPHSGSGNRLSGVEWADSSDRSLRQRNYGRRSFHCLLCAGKRKSPSSSGKYGADALFADENHKVYLTEGMEERFELMKDTYKVQK